MNFIDLFSGCGGLSLGLSQAGWQGIFAIEKNHDAFETLKHNLIDGERVSFVWPKWLPKAPMTTSELLKTYREELLALQGRVTLIAGGPPCQGFSMAGRRQRNDPRNRLSEEYVEIVKLIRPRFLLFENVKGFTLGFGDDVKGRSEPHSKLVANWLKRLGYQVYTSVILSSDFGVPQPRSRFLMLAIRNGDVALTTPEGKAPFEHLSQLLKDFKAQRGLPIDAATTVKDAIGDLITSQKKMIPCEDSSVRGFMQINYTPPKTPSAYQALMRRGMHNEAPNSLRLPRHQQATVSKFQRILAECPKGKNLSDADRQRLGMKKHTLRPLHPDMPSATVTTLPDDILHYSEPRILTARETARLQSFPDWFAFQGKYTTGGDRRKLECPRYTQIGNAVPPLVGEALGLLITHIARME